MLSFVPNLVLIQREALKYDLGRELQERFQEEGIETRIYEKRIPLVSKGAFAVDFRFAKRTIVVGLWTGREFQSCRPSAHYQLPLITGCPGMCQYCYLNTNLGRRPFIKINVNLEEIFDRVKKYVQERLPEKTSFEGSANSDPVAVENWTGSLGKAIKLFSQMDAAQFRFVTKYSTVDSLLGLKHNGKTQVRFSINCDYVINKFEAGVPNLLKRLEAASKVISAGYPTGFLVGPIMAFKGWREEYKRMFDTLSQYIPKDIPLSFELVTHRFTNKAKEIIKQVYPGTEVPFGIEERKFKFGQFGYGKYVYTDDIMAELKEHLEAQIYKASPRATILYFV